MQIKKAMILAAGYGKRMLPFTKTTPKPLINIGQKSLLERSIELLIKIGVKEIVLNVHYLSNVIEKFIKQFNDEPFFVLNPDTIWSKNYFEEFKVLENFYFTSQKPVLLLVDREKSHDKSFKGDFNFTNNQIITREKNNKYIFTGAQIINRSIFNEVKEGVFSMNLIWDQLINKKILLAQESNQIFFHVNNLTVFKELEKLKFID